jgi:hypothetical protein
MFSILAAANGLYISLRAALFCGVTLLAKFSATSFLLLAEVNA